MGFPWIDPNPMTNGQLTDTQKRLALAIEHTCTAAGMNPVEIRNAMADREGYQLGSVETTQHLNRLMELGLVRCIGFTWWWHAVAPQNVDLPDTAPAAPTETGVRIEWETDDIFRIFANGEEIADLCKDDLSTEGIRTLLDVVDKLGQHLDFPIVVNGEPGI